MATTDTATIVPSSWKTWVIPTLRPINPMLIAKRPSARAQPSRGQGGPEHRSERTSRCVSEVAEGPTGPSAGSARAYSHLDLDVDASRQAESHQGVHGLGRRVKDVDEPLMGADLELFPAVLVDERRAQDGELLDPRRERHRTDHVGAGALGGLHDLRRRLVEQPVVVGLEADPDPLLCHRSSLCHDADDGAGADGPATLADGEALADFDGDRVDQLDANRDVVTGHDHLGSLGQADRPGHVGGAKVELRAVAVVEGGMAATLLLGQDVDLGAELGVGLDRAGLGEDLAALDLLALDAPDEAAHVVAGAALVEQLLEHLDAGDH